MGDGKMDSWRRRETKFNNVKDAGTGGDRETAKPGGNGSKHEYMEK